MAGLVDPSARTWVIYTLEHPLTTEIRYVGVTHQEPEQRLREHICKARRKVEHNHRASWIQSLLAAGLRPVMTVREHGIGETWVEAERRWIAHFVVTGASLVNATPGGEGRLGYVPSKETREKLAEAARRRTGAKLSPEARENMREAQQRRLDWERATGFVRIHPPRSEETLCKMADAQRGKKASEETRRKLSESHRNPSQETRERLRQAVLQRPIEQRQAFAKMNVGRKFSDEHKRRIAEARKRAWQQKKGGCDNS